MRIFHFPLLFLLLHSFSLTAQIQLYQTTRANGSLQELDPNTGNIITTNVGGVTDGRGMDFSPLGGLYICAGNDVLRLDNASSMAVSVLSYAGESPQDLCFDAAGNLYVATNLNVYVYNVALSQQLVFAHSLTTVTGDGNGNKGWGIEVHPTNGEIYVVGRQGLRRFNPTTGAFLGSLPNTSAFGFPCLKFTSSGFNNAFVYIGSVISGQDQIRVYDSNLNFLRSFWPTHNGNPIDFELHPTTLDLYLFNTVTSNPTNRYSANEALVAGWATFANPSRGSALGDFNAVALPEHGLGLWLEERGEGVLLRWRGLAGLADVRYVVERVGENGAEELAWRSGREEMEWWDGAPLPGSSRYVVRALDREGRELAVEAVALERRVKELLAMRLDEAGAWARVYAQGAGVARMELRLVDVAGRGWGRFSGEEVVEVDLEGLARGIYLLDAQAYGADGQLLERRVFRVLR